MNIKDIDDKVIDRLWKGEEILPSVLWTAFWSLTEEEAREYVRARWYPGRTVRENHITRKLNRFWPAISAGVAIYRGQLEADTSWPKVYRVYNYSTYNSDLCYLAAGSKEEALRTAEILLPVSEGEERGRYVDRESVCPQDEVQVRVAAGNATILRGLTQTIADKERYRDDTMRRQNETIRLVQSRVDALDILLTSIAPSEEEPIEDSIAENPNENSEVHP
jgi:hypothetical protein